MKILLIHYRYRLAGGPELYLKKIAEYLKNENFEVDIFSINWDDNEVSSNRVDWYSPGNSYSSFSAQKSNSGLLNKIKRVPLMIYNKSVKTALENKILNFKPDLAYTLLFLGKLTPSIFDSLNKYKIPFFVRISDFSSVCQNSVLLRDSKVCKKCLTDGPINGVYNRCGGSLLESSIHYIIRIFLNQSNYKLAAGFISPSKNTIKILKESNLYRNAKFHYIPTFSPIEPNKIKTSFNNNKILAYWGRVSDEKSVLEVVSLFKKLSLKHTSWKFKIIGFDGSLYSNTVKEKASKIDRCELFNFMNLDDLLSTISDVNYFITSSKIVDNFPQSAVVALSQGIKVILPNMGSYTEVINSKEYGLIYDNFLQIENYLVNDLEYFDRENIIKYYIDNFGLEKHLLKLKTIFQNEIT